MEIKCIVACRNDGPKWLFDHFNWSGEPVVDIIKENS